LPRRRNDRTTVNNDDDKLPEHSRRGFVGGLTSLFAAASFSRSVSRETVGRVRGDADGDVQTVTSPDGSVEVTVDVADGVPRYAVAFEGTTVVEPSPLGFDFRNQPTFGAGADGAAGSSVTVTVTGTERGRRREEWEPVWGQYDAVRASYERLLVGLTETEAPGRRGNLEVRVFDDGLGFRFAFGEAFGDDAGRFVVASENTAFAFAGDYTSWWIENRFAQPDGEPGRFEDEYAETPLSAVPAGTESQSPGGSAVREGVHTPLTLRTDEGTYLSVHEADLTDYATLSLAPESAGSTTLTAELAPLPDGTKVSATAPHVTPWRTVQLGTRPGALVESSLVPLLNDELDASVLPTVDGSPDASWIRPRTYVGVWWTMISGSANWEYRTDAQISGNGNDPAAYVHGARTERAKRYMRFASENGIDSVLVEGWNEGWNTYPGPGGSELDFSVDGSTPDFDVREVTSYGRGLDPAAELTIHNETAGNVVNYEAQIREDGVFAGYEATGIGSIKNGYVSNPGLGFEGDGTVPTHNHHSQLAVNHHELVARAAARNGQLLERHEADKPTGKRRTYPNLATTETVKAQEYDGFGALGSDVGRGHHVTIPFTRMLAGPMSFQPGIFDITFNDSTGGRIQTTRAKQLAMYPTYLSGLQMAADRVEAYVAPTLSVGELVQAQAGVLDGFVTADRWRNAFGAHYVPVDPNRVPSGASVSWTVTDVPTAGEYDLHLRYASDAEANAERVKRAGGPRATLNVNGDRRPVEPPFTEYWDRWEVFTTPVTLEAGDNRIAIELAYEDGEEFAGDVGGFNLNTVAVTERGAPSPVPADYEGYTPEAESFDAEPEFAFVEAVPADWDDTRVVDAAIGDYAVTARRSGREWFLGAMTDGDGRALDVPLSFLSPGTPGGTDGGGDGAREGARGRGGGTGNGNGNGNGTGNGTGTAGASDAAGTGAGGPASPKYVAEIYSDAVGAADPGGLTDVRIDEAVVTPATTLLASMVESGGTAVRLRPARGTEIADLPAYERPRQTFAVAIRPEPFVGEPFVSATGSNDGDYVGGTEVEVLVDGEVVERTVVRLPPGASDATVEFDVAVSTPGTYDVTVRRGDGTTLASRAVTVRPPATVAALDDPAGDDDGPGGYVYPTDAAFRDGAFDLRSVRVEQTPSVQQYTFEVATLYDAFGGGNGFSPQLFVCWVRDPALAGGSTSSLDDLGANVDFAAPWHYRLRVDGFNVGLVDENGGAVRDADGTPVTPRVTTDRDAGTVTLAVDRAAFGGVDASTLEVVAMVQSENFGALRPVAETAGPFTFGGAKSGAVGNAPLVMDLVTPAGTSQAEALAYDADERATLPFVPLDGGN
jgi:hypothetical protein